MKDSQRPDSQNPYQAPQSATGQLKSNNAEYVEFKLFSMRRVGRIRYLLYIWLPIGIMGIIAQMVGFLDSGEHMGIRVVLALFILGISFTLTVRRLHDFNISGLFILFALIPLLNIILLIALSFVSGTDGPNRFGPPSQPNKPIEIWLAIGGLLVLLLPGIIKQYFQTISS